MWIPCLLLVLIAPNIQGERKCGVCDPEKCAPPSEECLAGMVKDVCNCCYVCGRREGEQCDGDFLPIPYKNRGYGPCGENLECRPRTDLAPGDPPEAQCVCLKTETLCASDGKTYENECQLTEARYKQRDGLRAMHRGPCRSAPKIVSPPEEASNYTGGTIAMSCEATGWPIPTFEWRVDNGDGNTIPLPSDDPKVSVQTRGGPSKYEVTSWLQLLSIQPKDAANYWCIAKNEEGETSAAARIVVLDFEGSRVSLNERSNDL